MGKGDEARRLFMDGRNCAQSVAAAFAEEMGMPAAQVERLMAGFGAGVGRMREVCGTVLGMTFVISALYEGDKGATYARVQEVAGEFRERSGSIVCRELLGLDGAGPDSPVPQERTREYYESRPCPELVGRAAEILERYLAENPPA